MIARSILKFNEFRQFLLDLGFTVSQHPRTVHRPAVWVFEHARTGIELMFRKYRSNERVALIHLDATRSTLERHDLIKPEPIENTFRKPIKPRT